MPIVYILSWACWGKSINLRLTGIENLDEVNLEIFIAKEILRNAVNAISSPMLAFLQDCCSVLGPHHVEVPALSLAPLFLYLLGI